MEELPHDLKMIIYAYAHEMPFLYDITKENYEEGKQWTYKEIKDDLLEEGINITERDYEISNDRMQCYDCMGISRLSEYDYFYDYFCYSCMVYSLKDVGKFEKYTHPRIKEFINEMYEIGKNNYIKATERRNTL